MQRLFFLLLLAATTAAAQVPPAGTLDKIRKSGTITLGYRVDAVPFAFEGQDKKPAGFSVELCERVVAGIARNLRLPALKTVWLPVTSQSRIDQVVSGAIDMECGTSTVTLGRQARVDFSLITFLDGGGFLARADGPDRVAGGLPPGAIAVSAGTTTEKSLRKLLAEKKLQNEVVVVPDHVTGVSQLLDGKVVLYASDRTVLIGLGMNAGRQAPLRLLDVMFSYEPYALVLRRDADFRLAVNRVLAEVFREGDIVKIYSRWFGQFGPPPELLQALYVIQSFQE